MFNDEIPYPMKTTALIFLISVLIIGCRTNEQTTTQSAEGKDSVSSYYQERYRPQFHFSPEAHWMNDPNGMIYHNGEYHLFYQYYPDGDVWGPMHWGHAISKDMMHWEHLPIALYPDSLGLIFSGSAVLDANNSSGLGTKENSPLVAVFTYHSMEKEKAGAIDYQTQGIAFSIDNGRTWKKHEGNPVLKNPGIKDFRDPKVFWHAESKKWVMTLAVKDHIELYGSTNLKSWNKLSEFGQQYGGHGGVWECPDLIQLNVDGTSEKKWVLLLSINPGGPNGGSATQFFVGNFDGQKFSCGSPPSRTVWVDHGPDDYAGVTWGNLPGERKVFLGWMSNWAYGTVVPTSPWRSAMTLPRDISLTKVNNEYFVRSSLSKEVETVFGTIRDIFITDVKDSVVLSNAIDFSVSGSMLKATVDAKDFAVEYRNNSNEVIAIGFDAKTNRFYIDRSRSGNTSFSPNFIPIAYAPRVMAKDKISFTIVSDVSSVEVFFDDGVTTMTSLFFPLEKFDRVLLRSKSGALKTSNLQLTEMLSTWRR